MKKIAGVLASLALASGVAFAQAPLTIGTSADAPPWESVDEKGQLIGFDIELGGMLCEQIKRDCTFVNHAFDGLIPSLLVKRFDFLMTSMAITEKRRERVAFTVPYAPVMIRLVSGLNMKEQTIDTPEQLVASLKGKTIGCQRGTTQEAMLRAHFPDSQLRTYGRIDEVIADLEAGRIDVASLNAANWGQLLTGDLAKRFDYIGPPLSGETFKELGEGYGIGLRKDDVQLKQELDAAITQAIEDGTVDKLAMKWLGYSLFGK